MKLLLTLMSVSIMYFGLMDTGDPQGLFSNLVVFYGMYFYGYIETGEKYKSIFLKIVKFVMLLMAGISAIGLIGIITIREIEEQYFITFSDKMRLGTFPLLSVHVFFIALCVKSVIFSSMEWVYSINKEKPVKNSQRTQAKGA